MQEHHTGHAMRGGHHQGMCGCGCGERRFPSRKEKIEMLEEFKESLQNEMQGVEEALKELKKEA